MIKSGQRGERKESCIKFQKIKREQVMTTMFMLFYEPGQISHLKLKIPSK